MIACPSCDGAGLELDADGIPTSYPCERCGGAGEVDADAERDDVMAEREIDAWRDEKAASLHE